MIPYIQQMKLSFLYLKELFTLKLSYMTKENDLLEETLSIAENGYAAAYQFLLEEYENNPEEYGPQTLYFLACLAGGANADAVSRAKAVFTWERKNADKLFLAVHGNTQNGQIARDDWEPILRDNTQWQLETIQSAEPDGYRTYRWSYDMVSYVPVAKAIEKVQNKATKRLFTVVFQQDAICSCKPSYLHLHTAIC